MKKNGDLVPLFSLFYHETPNKETGKPFRFDFGVG
jgi:hypothetical protein